MPRRHGKGFSLRGLKSASLTVLLLKEMSSRLVLVDAS